MGKRGLKMFPRRGPHPQTRLKNNSGYRAKQGLIIIKIAVYVLVLVPQNINDNEILTKIFFAQISDLKTDTTLNTLSSTFVFTITVFLRQQTHYYLERLDLQYIYQGLELQANRYLYFNQLQHYTLLKMAQNSATRLQVVLIGP